MKCDWSDGHWGVCVTQLNHITNKDIRKAFKVAPIPDKKREVRLWWYRHVVGANVESIARQALALKPRWPMVPRTTKKVMDGLLAGRHASQRLMPCQCCRLDEVVGEMQNWGPNVMIEITQRTTTRRRLACLLPNSSHGHLFHSSLSHYCCWGPASMEGRLARFTGGLTN